jgi:hypothetical protein
MVAVVEMFTAPCESRRDFEPAVSCVSGLMLESIRSLCWIVFGAYFGNVLELMFGKFWRSCWNLFFACIGKFLGLCLDSLGAYGGNALELM